jgi:signal transduction histidine kinase
VNALAVCMAMAAGIGIEAALTHGMVGLTRRPRDRARLAFAVAAVAMAVASLSVLGLYSAGSPNEHAAIMKWVFFPSSAVWIVAAMWFAAFYSDVRPLRWLTLMTAGFGMLVAVDLALPLGLLHSSVGGMRSVVIAGSRVMVMDSLSPNPLNIIAEALTIGVFVFLVYAVYQTYRRGERNKANGLAVAVLVFSVASALDTLTHYGVGTSLYTTQLCFAAVVLAMSIALRRETLRTESELAVYRSQLESMVEARVRDLDAANEQLALEVKDRVTAEDSLRRRVAELDGLQEIAQTLAERTDLAGALQHACAEVNVLLNASFSRVYLTREVVHGGVSDGVAEPDIDSATKVSTGSVVIVEDLPSLGGSADGRETVTVEDTRNMGLPPDLAGLLKAAEAHYLLLLPMVARGDVVGVLAIARDRSRPPFSSRDSTLGHTVADAFAAIVENERLHQQETRQAAFDERQRLARDLHDAVTQSIYSASLIAEALPAVWKRDPEEGRENLFRLRRLVRAALAEMRTLLFELRPGALEAAPLETLVERLGDALSGQAQIPVEVTVTDDDRLPSEVKITLYRIAQEAFSNIAKHSRASHVRARLTVDDGGAVLTVDDDGRGFAPDAVASERMGLRIMRERLDRIGGELEVSTSAGEGTRLTATWIRPAVPHEAPDERVEPGGRREGARSRGER